MDMELSLDEAIANLLPIINDLAEQAEFAVCDLLDEDHAFYDMSPIQKIRWRYVHADCDFFADMLNQVFGWEIANVSSPSKGPLHRLVITPDGQMVDATGYVTEDELKKRYRVKNITIAKGGLFCDDPEEIQPALMAAGVFLDVAPFNEPDIMMQLAAHLNAESPPEKEISNEIGYDLADAQQIASENPYTFFKPNDLTCSKIKVGDNVKMVFEHVGNGGAERMWVVVTKVNNDGTYEGTLNNDPYGSHLGIKYGDDVKFNNRNIIATPYDGEQDEPVLELASQGCLVSASVLSDEQKITHASLEIDAYDDETSHLPDSRWRFSANGEIADQVVSLGAVFRHDDTPLHLVMNQQTPGVYVKSETGWERLIKKPKARP